MASEIEINQLCRLCLVKEQVNVPIFEEEGDLGQIFLKISACLPVKISPDDSLPKKICDSCSCKLDVVYQFWNTSANSEKQLLKWLNQLGVVNTMTSANKKNSDSQMAHSINAETVINLKQEVVELAEHEDDDNMTTEEMEDSNDSENYMLQQQHIPYDNFSFQDGFPNEEPSHTVASSTVTSKTVNTRPKRKRRATTKALQSQLDSDDEDDSLLRGKITKTEEQSDSGEDPEPTAFVGLPSTSTDDQPGPSGINKGNSEAPLRFKNPGDIRRLLEMDSDEEEQIDDQDDIDFEPEAIKQDQHNSDSEEDLYDAMHDLIDEDQCEMQNLKVFIGRDNDTIWANKPLLKRSKIKSRNIKNLSGSKGSARNCKTKLECFLQIISLEIIDDIVMYTNIYIAQKKAEYDKSSDIPVRDRDYKFTSRSEIKAVFGALFLISVKRGNRADFSEFFKKNGTGLMILRANFSERRFRFLLRSLRFDDVTTRQARSITDTLAPIRDFQSAFVANCQKAYNVGESVTVDEMLVSFRGRCSFIQYMPQKPAKYGIQIYSLCDSQTFYTYNMMIYCRTQKPGPYATSNKPFDIVKNLTEPLKHTNRNITTDKWFSSYPLAEYLLSVGFTFLGTLRKNTVEIPAKFVTENKNLVPGNYLFGCNDTSTLVSFVTKKKVVLVLSTLHDENEVDGETGKPVQIMDYNVTKGGVDTVDLMCSRISTSRKTQRWPMTIFFRYLDIAGINSMRIYQTNNLLETLVRREYLSGLAMELMGENLRERAKICSLPKDLSVFLSKYREDHNRRDTNEVISNKRSFCYICGSKKNNITRLKCITCDKSICQKHSSHTCDNCRNNEMFDSDGDEI